MPEVTAGTAPVEQSQEGVAATGQEARLAQPDPVAVMAEQDTPEQPDEAPGTDVVAFQGAAATMADPPQEDVAATGQEARLAQPDPVAVTAEQDTPEQPDEAPETDAVAFQGAATAKAAPPPQPADVCQTVGPFKDRTASDAVVTWLQEHGREVSVRSGKMEVRIGYWVYLKKMPATEAERIMQELKNKGVEDYNQNDRNEISLGIYVKLPIAERRQKRIEALDYKPLVKPLYRNRTRYWVDVRETEADMLSAEEWDLQLANTPDSLRKSMACP
jgi:hypothetical protein